MTIKTKDTILKAIPVLFLISIIALTMFPPNIIQSNEKTTTLNVEKANDALLLDISHRSYDEIKLNKNEKVFLVYVFNIRVPITGGNRFNLWALPVESGLEGTTIDLELGDLPDGCVMGSNYIITDSRGGGGDMNLQFAVIAMFRAGNQKWEIMNPKVTVDNLLLALNERLSYWKSPPIRLNVEERLMDPSEFSEWFNVLSRQVKIGVIFSDPLSWGDQIVRFAEDDINQYCVEMDEHYDFEFMITGSGFSAEQHEHEVQMFDEVGLNLLIGGYLSHQAQGSLDYVNGRDMLLISPSSTASWLAFPGDNLFRLSPTDENEARVIASMLSHKGIKAAVLLRVEDFFTEGLAELIGDTLTGAGIEVEIISYPHDPEFMGASLGAADQFVEDARIDGIPPEEIAVIILGFEEVANLVEQVPPYVHLVTTEWFCHSATVFDNRLFSTEDLREIANELRMYGPMPRPDEANWTILSERYSAATEGGELNRNFSFYIANEYDACLLYAKAVIDTGTMDTGVIRAWLSENASTYYGVSGPVHLDENGDRVEVDYDIWAIRGGHWETVGNYTASTGVVELDEWS